MGQIRETSPTIHSKRAAWWEATLQTAMPLDARGERTLQQNGSAQGTITKEPFSLAVALPCLTVTRTS